MLAAFAPSQASLAAAWQPEGAFRVLLIAAPTLSRAARSTLQRESAAIWRPAGIQIEWQTPATRPDGYALRVLAVDRASMPERGEGIFVVGELLRQANAGAIALVSIEKATRIVENADGGRTASFDRNLGLVLGRAAAHEIGHYLLNTATHAPSGLMRARFDATEFADPASRAFVLDAEARTWVRSRIEAGLPLGPIASLPALTPFDGRLAAVGFSYPR
jgi:hypothetical protein